MTTASGSFVKDASGLNHYKVGGLMTLQAAAEDAIKQRPLIEPAWFWFNGTFVPMEPNGDVGTLLDSWDDWRRDYQRDPSSLLTRLEGYSTT